MKVTDTKVPVTPRVADQASETPKAQRADQARPADDKVTVAHPTVVEVAARAASSERATRLKELEAAVRQGNYKPDAGRIAERILEDAEITARLRASLL